jgi:two-component system LytT family sensor kinase
LNQSISLPTNVGGQAGADSQAGIRSNLLIGPARYWIHHALGWLGIWIVFSIGILADPAPQIELTNVKYTAGLCLGGFFISHILRALLHRFRWESLPWGKLVPRVVILCCLFGAAEATLLAPFAVTPLTFGSLRALGQIAQWSASASASVALLSGWSAAYLSYQFQKRVQEMEVDRLRLDTSVKESELRALRHQINPHFLFNSLNAIRSLIDEHDVRPREAITQLADLFRLSLQNSDKQLVSLRKELETVEAFLSLQKLRHSDRLQTKMQVDPHALDEYVPPFALQTLVENAVKYGIDSNAKGGVIVCLAQLHTGILLLSVQSPGSLSSGTNSTGIGLTNLQERLHLIFGTAATLRLFSGRPGEVTAEIIIPRKVKTGESSHS